MLQGTKLSICKTPEVSLERLIPVVNYGKHGNFYQIYLNASSETPGHSCAKLYRELVDFSPFTRDGSLTSRFDIILAHIRCLGPRLHAKESVLSPLQKTMFLRVVWYSVTMHACLSPARIESILMPITRIKLGQAITVKHF